MMGVQEHKDDVVSAVLQQRVHQSLYGGHELVQA